MKGLYRVSVLLILVLFNVIAFVSCQLPTTDSVVEVKSLTLDVYDVDLVYDESVTLFANVTPSNATDKTVTWTTSDSSVATVYDGKVTAVGPGAATVTATCGGRSAECKITVSVSATEGLEYNLLEDGTYEVSAGDAVYESSVVILGEYDGKRVSKIADNAFNGNKNLRKISVFGELSLIGEFAFSQCTNLSKVNLPDSIIEIGSYAFQSCTSLRNIKLPTDLDKINEYAFWGCHSLSGIEIPYGLHTMGKSAFSGCTLLSSINIPETVLIIEDSVFSACNNLTVYADFVSAPNGWSASWNASKCNVVWKSGMLILNLDGGKLLNGGKTTMLLNVGDTINLSDAEKYGHSFLGWYTDPEFTTDPITDITVRAKGDINLYAKWEKTFNFIHFHMNGGALEEDFDAKITVGEKMILPAAASFAGSKFDGWYTDKTYTEKITEITPEVDEDIHVYAKWNVDSYWSSESSVSVSMYFYGGVNGGSGGDLGSDMIELGLTRLTLRIDVASEGNNNWNDGSIRMRTGPAYAETHLIKFSNECMTTSGGVVLTAKDSDDVVDMVVDFKNRTASYYVNGEFVYTERFNNDRHICSDLTFYNYTTPPTGHTLTRGNLFQLTYTGDVNRTLAYDGIYIILGDIYENN